MAYSPVILRLIARHGRPVTLRLAGAGDGGAFLDVPLIAHVMDYDPRAAVAGSTMQQGQREIRIAQDALTAAGAPRAPRQGDRIEVDGVTLAITTVEARALRGASALIVLRARGA